MNKYTEVFYGIQEYCLQSTSYPVLKALLLLVMGRTVTEITGFLYKQKNYIA